MAEETMDKVPEEIAPEEDNQSAENKSEETTEEKPSVEEMGNLVKALQKGYTQTRQEFSELKDNLQTIADKMNTQTGAEEGENEYVTVAKLKQVLAESEQAKAQIAEANQQKAKEYVDNVINQLRADGVIKTDEEEQEFSKFAMEIGELDLSKTAKAYAKVKEERIKAIAEVAKTKTRQEEGSKVGTSSKTATGESRGIDYQKVKNTDWSQF